RSAAPSSVCAPSSQLDRAALAQWRLAADPAGRAEDTLLEAARSAEDTAQTIRMLGKLGIVGSERAGAALGRVTDDARAGRAEAALAAIGNIGGDVATGVLLSACDEGRLRTRQAAVAALASLDTEAAIARLTALAHDRSSPLWRTAVAALGSAGTPAALVVLR